MRFIQIFKRLVSFEKVIVTPLIGQKICEKNQLKATFVITTKESITTNLIPTYFARLIKALFLRVDVENGNLIYSTSDLILDTLPAFLCKLRKQNTKWFVCIFLVVPSLFRDYSKSLMENNEFSLPNFTRLFYFISQKLTIFLAKFYANQILVLNNADKEYLVRNQGVKESSISVVSGGVDYKHVLGVKSKKTDMFDGIFLGRFHLQKGLFDLVKVWRSVCNKRPGSRLCIMGDGPPILMKKLKALIKENDLSDNIELVGSKHDDEKFSLLKSSKVFLCPSYYESFAIVIAEAMACGLPVVAYNLPVYNDIYGEHISKATLGNVDQFADAVVSFLDDVKLRTDFGLKGQKFIQRYDWAEIAAREYQLMVC